MEETPVVQPKMISDKEIGESVEATITLRVYIRACLSVKGALEADAETQAVFWEKLQGVCIWKME